MSRRARVGGCERPGGGGEAGSGHGSCTQCNRVRRRAVPLAFGTGDGCDFLKPQVYSPVNCVLQVGGLSCDTVSGRPSKLEQDQCARHIEFTTFTILKCEMLCSRQHHPLPQPFISPKTPSPLASLCPTPSPRPVCCFSDVPVLGVPHGS